MLPPRKIFASLALLFFVFVNILGVNATMSRGANGRMGNCPFAGSMTKICSMGAVEHISRWQSLFTTTAPQKAITFALLILLAVVFVAVAILKRNLFLLFSFYATRWRLYIKQNPHLSLFNPLREAFSQGILNPKIF